jgi:asparagine synthase (glutamine-hydrolysing)
MCGIAGLVSVKSRRPSEELASLARRMSDQLVHRGPDDAGVAVDESAQLALSFRRLSIIDLSREGHQPMRSESGRYELVFNGEIYNFRNLQSELVGLGHGFRGHSDTEVLLAAIEQWGFENALKRASGMLGLALWDKQLRRLSLARDRAGKKPLYYGWIDGFFAFASELKAMRALPGGAPPVDRDALTLLLRHNYIPAPYSIYRNVYKLQQAETVSLPLDRLSAEPDQRALKQWRRRYWSVADVARAGIEHPFEGGDEQALNELDRCLGESVRSRMVADVPLGALLSGGIDSSLVTALMQSASSAPIKTFSIGFHEKDYNEARYASEVAAHLGTEHTELYISPDEAMGIIPELPAIYDEPLADVSQIPTHLVSRLAREQVTVALSGDGGDELFGGYTRYLFAQKLRRGRRAMPAFARHAMAGLLQGVAPERWDKLLGQLGRLMPEAGRVSPGDKLHKLAPLLSASDDIAMYRALFSQWRDPCNAVQSAVEPPTPLTVFDRRAPARHYIERLMQLDCVTYLPENILQKVDRASMAVSLEVRCPLLDPDVIAFAWRMPMRFKVRNGKGKWLLRQMLHRYVPERLVERPKMGFDVPVGRWLRADLRDWAEQLLDAPKLREQGFFNPEVITRKWREHVSGTRNWQYPLWNVLMFQAWLERNPGEECARAHDELHRGAASKAAST